MGTHEAFSSSSSKRWKYDVFLSFRGKDTRNNFTGHLYSRLKEAGINAFIDDSKLRRGSVITEELMQAIEGSKISVIIFSRGYGDSRWCLQELVEILECRKRLGQMVLPIFYDVDPTDVRNQTGGFGEAFERKHKGKDKDKVQKWRNALTEAANLSGWDLRKTSDGYEATVIQKIVEQITGELPSTYLLQVAPHLVGINSCLQDLISRLCTEAIEDVRMIGIYGMGGTGKTTIAKAIYNKVYHEFCGKVSFLENVKETTKQQNGLVGLQNTLLFDILKQSKPEVGIVDRGKEIIRERLRCIRVLVIIDDIDEEDQLNALAGNCDWFGPGSRIIITTRDAHMLKRVRKDSIYHIQPMHKVDALELFSWHAFGNSYPKKGYHELSESVVACCGCLPLALEVIGSFLFGKDITEWKCELEKLKRIPDDKIMQKLRLSFDGLSCSHRERDIFLDIACFFIGMDRNYVTQVLDGCDFFAGRGIRVLLDRCLVTVSMRNKLMMHDCLRDMGREIVRECYLDEPERRSRLWHPEDVEDVLTEHTGSERIEGLITLNVVNSEEKSFSTEAFTGMKRLRLLKLNYVKLTGDYKYISKRLRWLCWHGFPEDVIPDNFDLRKLVVMDLRYSKLTNIWVDTDQYLLEKLKIVNLSHSHDLIQTPNFSRLPNLEQLILKDCKSLCEIHHSIGNLKKLSLVNLKDCKMLKCLPRSFYKLKSIETLDLSGCSTDLTESLLEMIQLRTCLAEETAQRNVSIPSSVVRYEGPSYALLRRLYLIDCKLTEDSMVRNLRSLSLEHLNLGGNGFHSLSNLSGLNVESLILDNCTNLREIGDLPTTLVRLSVNGCTALESIPKFSYNKNLIFQMAGSHKLIEFPGLDIWLNCLSLLPDLDIWLNSLSLVQIEGHYNYMPASVKAAILKAWLRIEGGGLSFRRNEIPDWCDNINFRGGAVSFELPLTTREVRLCVCFVYSSSLGEYESNDCSIVVLNHTKRSGFVVYPRHAYAKSRGVKYLWLGSIANRELENGGFASVRVVMGDHFQVHQIGVELSEATPYYTLLVDCFSIPYGEALEYLRDQ